MKKYLYIIQTKDDKIKVEAKDRDEAFAKFFKEVADGKIPIEKLGNIIILKDRKEEYPFRTVPILYAMKLMNASDAVSNIMAVTGVKKREAEHILMDASFKDSHLIPLIEQLNREEHK